MKREFPWKATLIGLTFVIAGSLIYYLWGYKDNVTINTGSAILSGLAWIIIYSNFKRAYVKDNPDLFRKYGILLLFAFLIVMNWLGAMVAETSRIDNILTHGKTKTTIATVTRLDNEQVKGGHWKR